MPELPEVETVKEQLKKKVLFETILDVDVYHDNIIEFPNVIDFKKNIVNQKINDIKRRGKWLMFELDDYYLLSHLRMEGKYNFYKNEDLKSKHEHVVFKLSNGLDMRYHDTRKFGKMHLILKGEELKRKPLNELGVEPFSDELDVSYLKEKLKNKSIPIKTVLLDQSIITGIGNIYVDEILFLSKIHPLRKASLVTDKELSDIITNTRNVLTKAIKLGGTTIKSFSALTVHGKFQNELLVHGKEKEKCPFCDDYIKKIKVGGRGTYFCDKCQRL